MTDRGDLSKMRQRVMLTEQFQEGARQDLTEIKGTLSDLKNDMHLVLQGRRVDREDAERKDNERRKQRRWWGGIGALSVVAILGGVYNEQADLIGELFASLLGLILRGN